jgi:site-specific recombinase XerD
MKYRGVFEREPGSGIWWVRYFDAQGRLRREKAGTKSAAIALYRKRKTEALEGKKLPEKLRRPPTTFMEISRDALRYSEDHKRTHSDDVRIMKRLRSWFGDRSADAITADEIERHFQEGVDEHGWAPSTVNHHRSLLSLTYRIAIRNGKATSNPARATRHRKEDNDRVRWMSADEEKRLREVLAASWPEHLPELDLALHTGMRRSEMYGLDWEDVDLGRRFLRVKRSKNGESRYVRLNSVARKALVKLQERCDGTGAVIRNLAGTPVLAPRHWFPDAIKKAGIENFHWHDLRHTFASRLTMARVGIRAVQEALGHKSIAMTVRYSHLDPDFMADAVDKLAPEEESTATTETPIATDTRTDTEALASIELASKSVH